MTEQQVREVAARLAAPFAADVVHFKPQTVSGNRALAVAYIDARAVMDRLDDVLGIAGWQDTYTPLPDGTVVCRLAIRIGDEWVPREDVGGESDQKDEGDKRKSAFSDALKRVAVKFGVGRYLYSVPLQWCDYDAQKRQFTRQPTLHPDFLPQRDQGQQTVAAGRSLFDRICDYENNLVARSLCTSGELKTYLKGILSGKVRGSIQSWAGAEVAALVEAECKVFSQKCEDRVASAATVQNKIVAPSKKTHSVGRNPDEDLRQLP